jgi:hypothetical protein
MIQDHGSLDAALRSVHTAEQVDADEMDRLRGEIEGFQFRLDEFAEAAEVSKVEVLKTIRAVLVQTQRSGQTARMRIAEIEHLVEARIADAFPETRVRTGLDVTSSFGTVQIGGTDQELTMQFLYQLVCELKTSVSVLTERAKSTGIIFNGKAFASEADFAVWFGSKNTSGGGMAAFVDLVSVWSFSTVDNQETLEMLTERTKAAQLGLSSNYDAQYLNSFLQRYPSQLFGKGASSVTSTTIIEVLKEWSAWMGVGGVDGHKQKLTQAMTLASRRHRAYCDTNVSSPELRELAMATAEATVTFWSSFVVYLYDEYTLLTSFNLKVKSVLLLLSNQVVQICDDLFEVRSTASGVDSSNKLAAAASYAWSTLRALGVMEGYLKSKFRHHPAISSTFVRFITQHMAAQSGDAGGAGCTLATQIKALALDVKTRVTQEQFNKLDSKVDKLSKK